MIKVVNEKPTNTTDASMSICVGTHNGVFHCDEVVAIATLSILIKKIGSISVIRSRDLKFLAENTNLLVDIGGGKFDHHQKGGNGQRENGIKYASAGLIWKEFGSRLIASLSNNMLSSEEISEIAGVIDQNIIQSVDMEDNGQLVSSHPFQFISSFLPVWNKEINYDEKFEQCVNVVSMTLENIIESYISSYLAKKEIFSRITNPEKFIGNILELPCQTIPWTEEIISYNNNSQQKIDFVVFPYPAGGYALQCVPPSKEQIFSQRIPLPESWAGETSRLPEISGCPSAYFCHNGRFFARAGEYNDIIKMCQIATERAFSEEQNGPVFK